MDNKHVLIAENLDRMSDTTPVSLTDINSITDIEDAVVEYHAIAVPYYRFIDHIAKCPENLAMLQGFVLKIIDVAPEPTLTIAVGRTYIDGQQNLVTIVADIRDHTEKNHLTDTPCVFVGIKHHDGMVLTYDDAGEDCYGSTHLVKEIKQ
ncbi:hypothetical protein SAMN05660772_01855 [Pasteurella testudinis DSM 23072]|uniref:Uncharacterized protein n=1 Tax=Pasteurella testudinis DSM 23072 TaxID=1122938 RepID=A0A1W1UK05_9PAST|nr:hypothetical protein [Pasteurella testudinis]SMB81448.1 hypothetical protein SAMN05660772_01855 [Pasteurella testudinis DSM 23072]SUB51413.1 Uncharacterised protein [Pasteurella testudinis]